MLQHLEKELARWRNGESVPVHERITSLKDHKPIETVEAPASPASSQSPKAPVTIVRNELSEEERKTFDEERSKLYTQLDERVCAFRFSVIHALLCYLFSFAACHVGVLQNHSQLIRRKYDECEI